MKRYALILMMAVGVVLTGCFGDPEIEMPKTDGQSAMTLEFEVPQAPEVDVTTRSAADDAARENNIARLDIFVFDEDGNIVAGDEGHKTMTGGITVTNGKGRAQVYITIPPTPGYVWRQFYMVANGNDALFAGIATVDDIKAAVVSGAAAMPVEEFLMSGYTPLNKIDTANPSVNMSLRRAVSRVDVLLTDAVTNFEITQVRVINARNGAYVYEHLDAENNVETPVSSSLVGYPFVAVTEESQKRDFTSRLYAYENCDATKDDAATTAIIIGGIYKSQEVFYRVNLHDNASQAQIRRNYVYKVRILAVNGPGNTSADGAILDAPQNLDYEIVDWDYSLHTDVVYDGKHYLGLSRSEFTYGQAASTGTANIVTNLEDGDVAVTECDANGDPYSWAWLDGTVSGSKVTVTALKNEDNTPRVGYLLVQSSTKSRLKLIIKVQQYHSDDMLMMFSPSVIMAPSTASTDKSSTGTFMFPTGTEWMIESVNMLEDASRGWFRVTNYTTGVWRDSGGDASVKLEFEVDAMNPEFTVRTAVVTVKVKYGAMEEKKTVTVSQANATEDLTLSRYYIGKTGAPAVEKVDIMSYGGWNAYFATADELNVTALGFDKGALDWAYFADENYTKLNGTDSWDVSSTGSGSLYIVFDAVAVDKNAFVIVESGGKKEAIRLKRFTQRVDKINGYETIELPGHYQWGRRPDGYETSLDQSPTTYSHRRTHDAALAANQVKRQPRFSDPAYGKSISPGNYTATTNAKSFDWLNVDNSVTPGTQRDKTVLWDTAGKASDVISETNMTGRKSDFDPCPDGWRVPTALEMENIFVYGPNRVDASAVKAQTGTNRRIIKDDDGQNVELWMNLYVANGANEHSMKYARFYPVAQNFVRDYSGFRETLMAKFYWTSTASASGGPYAVRFLHNDHPEVFWTVANSGNGGAKWPNYNSEAPFQNTASMLTQVRCIRDTQTEEELMVSRRRTTVDYEAQEFTIDLTANNIVGSWTAFSSDPSWLIVDGQSTGSDDTSLTLRVTQNDGGNREGYIRITTPSGSVANIVVRQTDHTGVCYNGLWMMDRNLGATRANHHEAPYVFSQATIGDYYKSGSVNNYKLPSHTGSGTHNNASDAWNKNSRMTLGNSSEVLKYPYPVKNEVNDPCPDGWRVMSPYEANRFVAQLTPTYTITGSGGKYIMADNGRRINFPNSGINGSGGTVSHYATSGFRGGNMVSSIALTYTSIQAFNMTTNTTVLRCVQDVADDWTFSR